MKKFIPILSSTLFLVCMQNCVQRDEDIISDNNPSDITSNSMMMRQDSARSSEILDPDPPDPPVRDGDNWRLVQKNNQ